MKRFLFIAAVLFFAVSCKTDGPEQNGVDTTNSTSNNPPKAPRVKGPGFNADSAYASVKTIVGFGPRVPGTPAHTNALNFITGKLKSYGLEGKVSTAPATYHGMAITMKNIFAQYKPELKDRILLLTHWDTRPVADEDVTDKDKPFDGADDGGSGTAVMLEIARVLQQQDPNIGVDLLFVDAEDGGDNGGAAEGWCLGSQYWAQNTPPGYKARFGILLDMVGGKGAMFPREGSSVYFAAGIVEKVWRAAAGLGYSNLFTNDISGQTTDDHVFVNKYAGIPTIDIVHYNMQTMSYPSWHHKHSDNMDVIDTSTMQAVGNVLVDVIYNELPPAK